MRYYNIKITDPKSGKVVIPAAMAALGVKNSTYFSLLNDKTLTAALDVEIDAFVAGYADPVSDTATYLRVWGVSLAEIAQSKDLNGFDIEVSGGFQRGLPLATAAFSAGQSGVLFAGNIQQCIGNWIGTEMTLDFAIVPGQKISNTAGPLPLNFDWKTGTSFADAIRTCLQVWRGFDVQVRVSPNLVNTGVDQHNRIDSMQGLADYVQGLTRPILGGNYSGVQISQPFNKTIVVTDNKSDAQKTTTILFQDMIGQPTWVAPGTVQVKCPMRADIRQNDFIKFDQLGTLVTTLPNSQSQERDKSIFQGRFAVSHIHHVGRFRSPSPDAWVTVIDAVTN